MKIAIPTSQGLLCPHFGHCDEFTIIEVNTESKEIIATQVIEAPEHEPGLLPRWLYEKGANLIIAGGMGQRAQMLFAQNGVQVVVGAPSAPPADLVRLHLSGELQTGSNLCDH
jgi:predicted Fe-Mo cluster-binding NifX family protein